MADKIHRNSLKPGHKLHWYRIESILGQGGFGITYLAHDFNLDRQVAIKEYLPIELAVRERDFSVHPVTEDKGEKYKWGLDRFITEARTLAKFSHPNIVRVLNVFEANNTAYMVMEYEHGESLQDILSNRKTLEEAELLNILLPVLGGLQMVHDKGFIHRDIKPANIFIRNDSSPVLIDFGSARQALGVATKTLTSLVSPGYAPFEQYHSKSDQQGPWTDIYGLGATLYRAIAGVAPMDALDRSQMIHKDGRDTFVTAVEIGAGRYSERFLQAIDHALQFKEEDRPQSISDWRRGLSSIHRPVETAGPTINNVPTEVPTIVIERLSVKSEQPPDFAASKSHSNLWRTGGLAALLIAVVSLLAYSRWRDIQESQQESQYAADLKAVREMEFVDIPGGTFLMGCSGKGFNCTDEEKENPRHLVLIKPFRMSKFEITVQQFRYFSKDTERTEACNDAAADDMLRRFAEIIRHDSRFTQSDTHPVVCVSWGEAKTFADWVSSKTGKKFRLPTEAEWEYAARGGVTARQYWGDSSLDACGYENVADRTSEDGLRSDMDAGGAREIFPCSDNFVYTSPVGSLKSNPYGLHDMLGNVSEWTEDCWNPSHNGAPADGTAWTENLFIPLLPETEPGTCDSRVVRGGDWASGPRFVRYSSRQGENANGRFDTLGFRLVEDMRGIYGDVGKVARELATAETGGSHDGSVTAWVVQLGNFVYAENAETLNKKLRQSGYSAFVEPLQLDGAKVFRVRVGPELRYSSAQSVRDRLQANLGLDGIVVPYP